MNSPRYISLLSLKFIATWRYYLLSLLVITIVLVQTVSVWFYQGPKVDEAELVFFGVGFLGGDLDPVWNHYGHLGMYMLAVVYFLLGCLLLLLGVFGDFTEYGAYFLGKGYFFMLARLLIAMAIVVSVLIFSKILSKLRVSPLLIAVFVLLVCFSPGAVKYANYVRTDALVALFTICLLYFLVFASSFQSLLWAAIFTAAAVACKISALPISGALGLLIILMALKKQVTITQAFVTGLVFLLFVQLFSPYMDYFSLFKQILLSETGEASNSYRIYYVGIEPKLTRILEFHFNVVGQSVCIMAVIGVFLGYFTRFRRLVMFAALLVVFTLIPYLVGATLREYWFLSTYLLMSLLAFISVLAALDFIERLFPTLAYRSAVAVTLISLIVFPLQTYARTHVAYIEHHRNSPLTNKLIAQQWLEKNHLGVSSILIDKNFPNVYPSVFDPAYLGLSRSASGMYNYHKGGNRYLSAIFEKYLYELYLNDGSSSLPRSKFLTLKKLRLDFAKEVSFAKIPKVCSKYSKICHQTILSGVHNLTVLDNSNDVIEIEITGEDPYLVFDIDMPISIDRSFYAEIESDADAWQLFYDFGEGVSAEQSSRYFYKSQRALIMVPSIKPIFNGLGRGDKPRKKIDVDKTVLFVTSPSGYGRFNRLRGASIDSLNPGEKRGLKILNWHEEITSNKLVKRFAGPSGSPIEIYDISEYARAE